MKSAFKGVFYGTCRALARVVPPDILYFLLYPSSAVRGVRPALKRRTVPVRHIPPRAGDGAPSFVRRWHYQAAIFQRWLPLFWPDVWAKQRWASRLTADGAAALDALVAEQPVVAITVHTGAMVVLGGWLMSRGLGVGSVIIDRERWLSPESVKARSDPRWQTYVWNSASFLAGDTRQMVRYLAPGRVLLLPADHPLGRSAEGDWPGGRLRLAVGGLRIARMTGAAVVPIIVTGDGPWRFHVHVGTPLPAETLASGDNEAAVAEIARQLMPLIERRPFEALPTLVEAVSAAKG